MILNKTFKRFSIFFFQALFTPGLALVAAPVKTQSALDALCVKTVTESFCAVNQKGLYHTGARDANSKYITQALPEGWG